MAVKAKIYTWKIPSLLVQITEITWCSSSRIQHQSHSTSGKNTSKSPPKAVLTPSILSPHVFGQALKSCLYKPKLQSKSWLTRKSSKQSKSNQCKMKNTKVTIAPAFFSCNYHELKFKLLGKIIYLPLNLEMKF